MIAKVIEDKKWEYKVVEWSNDLSDLNASGQEGWELVCRIPKYSYIKDKDIIYFVMKRSYTEKEI